MLKLRSTLNEGYTRKASMTDYKKMHTSDLLDRAMRGDSDATLELVERQQDGRAVRLYPTGRDGPDDEVVTATLISAVEKMLVVRVGRPSNPLMFDEAMAGDWLNSIAGLMHHIIKEYESEGLNREEIEAQLSKTSTEFNCNIYCQDSGIVCEIEPAGYAEWRPTISAASQFVTKLLHALYEAEWKLDVSEEELETIKLFMVEEDEADS